MTNGFLMSFPNGNVFTKAEGRCTAKGAREVKLKAEEKKLNTDIIFFDLDCLVSMQWVEKRDIK